MGDDGTGTDRCTGRRDDAPMAVDYAAVLDGLASKLERVGPGRIVVYAKDGAREPEMGAASVANDLRFAAANIRRLRVDERGAAQDGRVEELEEALGAVVNGAEPNVEYGAGYHLSDDDFDRARQALDTGEDDADRR